MLSCLSQKLLTDAVCSPPGPCVNLPAAWLQGIASPWEDQYHILSPTRVTPAVASELSLPCDQGGGPGGEGKEAVR